jgi:hypothetical protein
MVLWGPPLNTSAYTIVGDLMMENGTDYLLTETGGVIMDEGAPSPIATCYVQTPIVSAEWAPYEAPMRAGGGGGPDGIVQGKSSFGSDSVTTVSVTDSGRAFLAGQQVTLYLYGAIEVPQVLYGGTGYANGEQLVFVGGITGSARPATGYVTTNNSGGIAYTTLTFNGSGYVQTPNVSVSTANGTGGVLVTSLSEYDEYSEVTGSVQVGGVGTAPGGWTTTRGFLNADKYIQDSYYYQDFSYELQVARDFSGYRDLLAATFHPSGSQMFGKYTLTMNESSTVALVSESSANGEPVAQVYKSPSALIFDIIDNSQYFPVVSP